LEELLKMIYKSHLQGIKFLITSRPDVDLAKLCSSFTSDAICRLYDVPTDTVKADIATYLQAKLPNLWGMAVVNDLMHQADGLFIFAATAVRYITRRTMTKREQIRLLGELGIRADGPTVSRNINVSPIDGLYKQVMSTAFRDLADDMLQERLYALHTLLCTQERVSTTVAGELYSVDPDTELVELVVDELRAVLYVKDDRVFWYHASFPDFIFSQARSGNVLLHSDSPVVDMHCNEGAHHGRLAHACFRIMKTHLRFNICDLPSSFLLDSEVPDLDFRIQKNIGKPESLTYSCLHWAQHLAQGSSDDDWKEMREFLQLKALFWIEAMNLLGFRARCTPMLQQARKYVLKVRILRYFLWTRANGSIRVMVSMFRVSTRKLGKQQTFRHSLVGARHVSQHHTCTFRHWQYGRGVLFCPKCGRSNSLMFLALHKQEMRSAYRSCRSGVKTV